MAHRCCSARYAAPFRYVIADSAYAGKKLETALTRLGGRTLEIVKRADEAKGFRVQRRRWGR